jgi:signal transduction histidine kinase
MGQSENIQNGILVFLAMFLTAVIFVGGSNVSIGYSISSAYTLVLFYCWILPGNYTASYAAIICSILTLVGAHLSPMGVEQNLQNPMVNHLFPLVAIWVCASMVAIAKRSFDSLESSKENLEEMVECRTQQLEQSAYIASHDLQEPLNTVRSFSTLLKDTYYDSFDEKGKKSLEFIVAAVNRMSTLVKSLLDYSRIGNQGEREVVECNVVLQEIESDFHSKLTESGGELSIGQLPKVYAHKVEIRLLFQNLISNALKFGHPNIPPKVEVSAVKKRNERIFAVKDNGIGIEDKYRHRIFEIFQRLHNPQE